MSLHLPRLWDGAAYSKRLHPISCSVYQSLQPLSTANMVLPDIDDISALDWVRIETPDGKIEYYRVVSVDTDTITGQKNVYLEHGACILGDIIIPDIAIEKETDDKSKSGADLKEYPEDMTALFGALVGHILQKQPSNGRRWSVGTVETNQIIYAELGGHTLLDALTTIMQYVPDYQLEFEQRTETDWRVNVKHRPTEVVSEGRLSRNLKTCSVGYDIKDIVTSVYCEGLGYTNSRNVSIYGIKSIVQNLSDTLTDGQKRAIISSYLSNHDHPFVSVTISGVELANVTGVSLDKFVVGSVCRLAVPWLNIVVDEVIIDKKYNDIFNRPEEVSITLANATPDLVIAMAAITSQAGGGGGGGGGGGMAGAQKEAEKKKKRFETHFEQTDEYFRLIATDTEWDEMGKEGKLTAYGQIVLTSENIELVTAKTGVNELGEDETLYSRIGQKADEINLEVGKVKQQADETDEVVTQLSLTVDGINISGNKILIKGNIIDMDGYVTVSELEAEKARITTLETDALTAAKISGTTINVGGVYASGGITTNGFITAASYLNVGGNISSNSDIKCGTITLLTHSHEIEMTASGGTVTARIGRPQVADGTATFDIAATQFFIDAVAAASAGVTLSGSWSGSTYTATASNGEQVSTSVGTSYGSWSNGSIPIYATANGANRASGSVSMTNPTGFSGNEYSAGRFSISFNCCGKSFTQNMSINASYSEAAGENSVDVSSWGNPSWSAQGVYVTITLSNGRSFSHTYNDN